MIISYTFLSTYKRCPRRAYLQYVKKVISPDKIDQRNFLVGQVVDELFTNWATDGKFEVGWMEKNLEQQFDYFSHRRKVRFLHEHDEDNLRRKALLAVQRLEDCSFGLELDKKRIYYQYKGNFNFNGFPLFAKLDMYLPEEGRVIDLKVTSDKRWLDPFQLMFYAFVLRKNNKNVEFASFLVPLMKEFHREVSLSIKTMADFEFELTDLLRSITEENWLPCTKDCFGCPVAQHCDDEIQEYIKDCKPEGSGLSLII